MAEKELTKKISKLLKGADKLISDVAVIVTAAKEIKDDIKGKLGKSDDERLGES